VATAPDPVQLAAWHDDGRFDDVLAAVWVDGGPLAGASAAALACGRTAAQCLGQWATALALGNAVASALDADGAPSLERARAGLLDFGPLVSLGRAAEADALLAACRPLLEREGGPADRAALHACAAHAARLAGDRAAALREEHAALRARYEAGDAAAAVHHHNLASLLMEAEARSPAGLHHRLAAAVLAVRSDTPLGTTLLTGLAGHLAAFGAEPAPLPASFAALVEDVRAAADVDLAALFDAQPADHARDGDEALRLALGQPTPAAAEPTGSLRPSVRAAFEGALRSLAEARTAGASAADLAPAVAGLRRTVLALAPGNEAELDGWLERLAADPAGLLAALPAPLDV
jgi:hypothetical protein